DKFCDTRWQKEGLHFGLFLVLAQHRIKTTRNCHTLGGNLAPVRDSQENGAFQNLIGQSKAAWIGGTDAQQEGKWRWTDGTAFTYTNWAPGQPDNWQGNENCLHITTEGRRFWNDLDCQTPLPSVCIKKLY
uniref:C-type lectin domain-containing protein n=1 Tax=Mastacembelus armatus TaxID=205130 RepID=A0A3Q3RXU7_9TELE